MNVIARFEDETGFLSNFYTSLIEFPMAGDKVLFSTAEHAFQAAKFKVMKETDPDKRKEYVLSVSRQETPSKAKYAGKVVTIDLQKWEEIRVQCMREVVFEKFRQNETLRQRLLDTGHALLVEGNDHGDKFWGRCEGKGSNVLGSILMEVRGFWYWRDICEKEDFRRVAAGSWANHGGLR